MSFFFFSSQKKNVLEASFPKDIPNRPGTSEREVKIDFLGLVSSTVL